VIIGLLVLILIAIVWPDAIGAIFGFMLTGVIILLGLGGVALLVAAVT
jgi:hypothetical protein